MGYGTVLILLGSFIGILPLHLFFTWYDGGPAPGPNAIWTLSCLLLIPLGLALVSNAIRGLPRLTIGSQGLSLQRAFSTKWAHWDSIGPFAVETRTAGRSRRQIKRATAGITGPNAGLKRAATLLIPDHFDRPIDDIVAEINAARALSLGVTHLPDSVTAPAQPTPVGLPGFAAPWLTFALLAALIGVFIQENIFPVTPAVRGAPSLATLIAMGALNHASILLHGEWYRLFTAPLLHANFGHLVGNGVALLLGGWLLERLVGRLWFLVFFATGALGGSLASLAIQPANLVSVGASGALMGMFAGVFVCSFRMSSATSSRIGLQVSSLRILVPSVLPFFSSAKGEHIDYGAHIGGALAGAALALALLLCWPQTAFIPQWRRAAAIIAAIGLVAFLGSAGLAVANYPRYQAAATHLPATLPPAPSRPVPPPAAADGRASYLRGDKSMSRDVDRLLGKCAQLFPKGTGAVPGINCSN